MGNILLDLCCFGSRSAVSYRDVTKADNLHDLMIKTTTGARHLAEDQPLMECAVARVKELVAADSHGTIYAVDALFDAAKAAVGRKERYALEWLQTCITRAVLGLEVLDVVVQGGYGSMTPPAASRTWQHRAKEPPNTSKPRAMKKASHHTTLKVPASPEVVVSSYESDVAFYETVERKLAIPRRKNGNMLSDQEPDTTTAGGASKRKKKKKQKAGGKNAKNEPHGDTLTVNDSTRTSTGALTAPCWWEGEDPGLISDDGSVTTDGGGGAVGISTSESRRKLGKAVKNGSLKPGAGYKAIVQKLTGSSEDIPFVKPFFFPDHDGASFDSFISVLYAAKKTLDVCVFHFTDYDVVKALVNAHRRKVKIRIISDDEKTEDKCAGVKRLNKKYGIPYRTDNNANDFMHNKFAIIDRKILITGSYNWSRHARFDNYENIIVTNATSCVAAFNHEFERLWDQFDSPVVPEGSKPQTKTENGEKN